MTDENLTAIQTWNRHLAGDESAMPMLYEDWHRRLCGFIAKKYGLQFNVTGDLAAEVWEKLLKCRARVRTKFKTWLFNIADCTVKDYFDKQTVRRKGRNRVIDRCLNQWSNLIRAATVRKAVDELQDDQRTTTHAYLDCGCVKSRTARETGTDYRETCRVLANAFKKLATDETLRELYDETESKKRGRFRSVLRTGKGGDYKQSFEELLDSALATSA